MLESKLSAPDHDTTRHVGDHCLCLHAQRAARHLARLFDEAFRPLDLTNGQFSLMMCLNRPKPARVKEVAAFLAVDRTTLTAALKALERRGLARIAVDPADKRGRLLSLTEAGRDILAQALPIWERTHGALEARFPDSDRLRADLRALA